MASRSAVELDFFRMERDCSSKPLPNKLFDRRRSFRDIQSFVSKMNPELLKTVIASGFVDQSTNLSKSSSFSVPVTPKHEENVFPAFPLYTPTFRSNTCGSDQSTPESGPLTIFYNGTVTVFDVPRHEAENILKIAKGGVSKTVESVNPELALSSTDQHQLLETLKGGSTTDSYKVAAEVSGKAQREANSRIVALWLSNPQHIFGEEYIKI
ncbi:unnamed protein product [Camellia sinensis]